MKWKKLIYSLDFNFEIRYLDMILMIHFVGITFPNGIQIECKGALGKFVRTNTPKNLPEDAELIAQKGFIFSRPNGEVYKADDICYFNLGEIRLCFLKSNRLISQLIASIGLLLI